MKHDLGVRHYTIVRCPLTPIQRKSLLRDTMRAEFHPIFQDVKANGRSLYLDKKRLSAPVPRRLARYFTACVRPGSICSCNYLKRLPGAIAQREHRDSNDPNQLFLTIPLQQPYTIYIQSKLITVPEGLALLCRGSAAHAGASNDTDRESVAVYTCFALNTPNRAAVMRDLPFAPSESAPSANRWRWHRNRNGRHVYFRRRSPTQPSPAPAPAPAPAAAPAAQPSRPGGYGDASYDLQLTIDEYVRRIDSLADLPKPFEPPEPPEPIAPEPPGPEPDEPDEPDESEVTWTNLRSTTRNARVKEFYGLKNNGCVTERRISPDGDCFWASIAMALKITSESDVPALDVQQLFGTNQPTVSQLRALTASLLTETDFASYKSDMQSQNKWPWSDAYRPDTMTLAQFQNHVRDADVVDDTQEPKLPWADSIMIGKLLQKLQLQALVVHDQFSTTLSYTPGSQKPFVILAYSGNHYNLITIKRTCLETANSRREQIAIFTNDNLESNDEYVADRSLRVPTQTIVVSASATTTDQPTPWVATNIPVSKDIIRKDCREAIEDLKNPNKLYYAAGWLVIAGLPRKYTQTWTARAAGVNVTEAKAYIDALFANTDVRVGFLSGSKLQHKHHDEVLGYIAEAMRRGTSKLVCLNLGEYSDASYETYAKIVEALPYTNIGMLYWNKGSDVSAPEQIKPANRILWKNRYKRAYAEAMVPNTDLFNVILVGCRLSWAGIRKHKIKGGKKVWNEKTKTYDHPAVLAYLKELNGKRIVDQSGGKAASMDVPNLVTCLPNQFAKINIEAFNAMYSVYYSKPQFRPTRCKRWLNSQPADLQDLAKQALVLYPHTFTFEQAYVLAWQREPVNIEMERYYDEDKLFNTFQYRECPYGGADVSPNLAVFTRTPFWSDKVSAAAAPSYVVNVLHLIGAALDVEQQKDYAAFYKNDELQLDLLVAFYRQVYTMMIKAALIVQRRQGRKLTLICVGLVGSSAFWQLPQAQNYIYDDYVTPVLDELIESYANKIEVRVVHHGDEDNVFEQLKAGTAVQEDLDTMILTNAWDCWSMLGNGNAQDHSLDGYYGRASAIAALGWPRCNEYIKFIPVDIPLAFSTPTALKHPDARHNRYARQTVNGQAFEMLVDDSTGITRWQRLTPAATPYPDDPSVRHWLQQRARASNPSVL